MLKLHLLHTICHNSGMFWSILILSTKLATKTSS